MIACVWPSRIVSVTPLRISLGPSSVSTLTCRSLISRVLIASLVGRVLDVDEHVVAVDTDGVDRHRLGRREGGRLAGAQVEGRPVQPALDEAVLDLALGQRDRGVGALVADR